MLPDLTAQRGRRSVGASQPKFRSFTGCWACRFKKRRCDEGVPFCALCLKHGDTCSYDVRLVWLEENMLQVSQTDGQLQSCADRPPSARPRLSKSEFQMLAQYRGRQADLTCCHTRRDVAPSSFTISLRRLKVYDNAVEAIHGRPRQYDANHVLRRLEQCLQQVEAGPLGHAGPYGAFPLGSASAATQRFSPSDSEAAAGRRALAEKFFAHHWEPLISKCDNVVLHHAAYARRIAAHVSALAYDTAEFPSDIFHAIALRSINLPKWLARLRGASTSVQVVCYMLLSLLLSAQELHKAVLHLLSCTRPLPLAAYALIATLDIQPAAKELFLKQVEPSGELEEQLSASVVSDMLTQWEASPGPSGTKPRCIEPGYSSTYLCKHSRPCAMDFN
ncbi:AaceriAFL033Wp [[Ashbya] aceris (nom. inval.)]|nr:AaceriAFL033Wp [[Ashbya] aceris (nom. inval.)]